MKFLYLIYLSISIAQLILSSPMYGASAETLHKNLDLVLEKIEESYPGPIDYEKVQKAMLDSLVKSVDSNGAYLEEKDLKNLQSMFHGKNNGLGLIITPHKQGILVTKVFEKSPGSREGILAGDIITEIDDHKLSGISFEEFSKISSEDKPYKIKITRKNKTITKIITPSEYAYSSLELMWVENIACIKINFLQESSANEMRTYIEQIKNRKTKGIIIDIRDSPGGSLNAAADIANLLLDGDVIVEMESKNENNKLIAAGPDLLKNIPIIVLQNKNTYSAAEILSASLQASKRAKIAGQNSAGAATAKKIKLIPSTNGGIIITTSFLNDKNKKRIGKDGVSPDIVLKETKEFKFDRYDHQISDLLKLFKQKVNL